MATDLSDIVQRDFQYCIIDEVDSILIDEARTPLIISGQVERPQEKYRLASEVASQLIRSPELGKDGIDPEGDYEVDEKRRNVTLTDLGYAHAADLLGVQDLYDSADPWAHFVNNALKAKELFAKDVNYIVRNNDVVIVDEFTGRVMPGRRWSDGLHQAIESKEGLPIQPETQTLASITYQNFFLLYPRLAGMTGTAKTEELEFEKTYKLEVTTVPTALVWIGPIKCTKPKRPSGGRLPMKRQRFTVGRDLRWWEQQALKNLSCCRRCSQNSRFPTTCSTPSQRMLSERRKSSPRPAGLARSPSPQTWLVAAQTSSLAATVITWLD
jgi:hypothetical protein